MQQYLVFAWSGERVTDVFETLVGCEPTLEAAMALAKESRKKERNQDYQIILISGLTEEATLVLEGVGVSYEGIQWMYNGEQKN